jgi:hypothetical protein
MKSKKSVLFLLVEIRTWGIRNMILWRYALYLSGHYKLKSLQKKNASDFKTWKQTRTKHSAMSRVIERQQMQVGDATWQLTSEVIQLRESWQVFHYITFPAV